MDDKHQDELIVCISGLSNQKSSKSTVGRKKLYDQTKIVSKEVFNTRVLEMRQLRNN